MPPIFHSDIASVQELKAELEKLIAVYSTMAKDSTSKLKKMRDEIEKANAVTKEQAEDTRKLTEETKKLSDQEKKLKKELTELNREGSARARAIDKEIEKEKDLQAALRMEVKSLDDLMKKTNAMVAARKRLDLTTEHGRKEEERLGKEIKKNSITLKEYDAKIDRHQRNVGNYTMQNSRMAQGLGQVRQAFKKNITVTNEYNQQITQTQTISQRVTNVSQGLRASWMGIAVVAGTVVAGVRKWVSMQSELSDAIADVQKTTGLTKLEVRGLNKELLQLNTRSSQKELLDLAYVAGKLGIKGVQDVLGFTRAADKIGVALGRELGNAEEAARVIGKLTDLFNLKQEFGLETAMTKIGSAINSLGQSSTANEQSIVDFTVRMGGIANQARISIADVMGLASALDQLGQSPEMAATALSQTLVKLYQNTEKFARVAGLEVESFTRLLQTDANEALLQFIEALAGDEGGLARAAQLFDQLGIDGRRAIGVLSALGTNMDTVRKSQSLSNEELRKGSSIMDEFNVKNETLGASLGKTAKALGTIFQSSFLSDALKTGLDNLRVYLGDYSQITDEFQRVLDNIVRKANATKKAIGGRASSAAGSSRGGGYEKIVFEISDEEKARLAKLEKERLAAEKEFFNFRKSLGLLTTRELYIADIDAIKKSSDYARLEEEEKQQAILSIKMKYVDIFEKERKGAIGSVPTLGAIAGAKGVSLPKKLDRTSTNLIPEGYDFDAIDPEIVLDPNAWQETFAEINTYAQLFGGAMMEVMDMISQANQRELQAELDRISNRYSFEERLLNENLKKKLINENEFNARKILLDQKRTRDEAKLKKEAAKQDKNMAITKAIINTALGVTGSLAQGGPLSWLFALVSAALGAVEIAVISSQTFAKGGHQVLGKDGSVLRGKRHAQGGVNLGEVGTAEAGEYMGIISRPSTAKYQDIVPTVIDSLNNQSFENVFAMKPIVITESKYQKKMYQEMTKSKAESHTVVTDKFIITQVGNQITKVHL